MTPWRCCPVYSERQSVKYKYKQAIPCKWWLYGLGRNKFAKHDTSIYLITTEPEGI